LGRYGRALEIACRSCRPARRESHATKLLQIPACENKRR